MKILHISGYAVRGGCEKNCLHFISGSPQHQHLVVVLGTEGPMSKEWKESGAEVRHLDLLKENILTFTSSFRKAIKNEQYGLAIAWSTIRLPLQLHALDRVTKTVKVYLGNPVGKTYKPLKDILLSKIYGHRSNVELMACSVYVSRSYQANAYYSKYPVRVSLNPVPVPVPQPTPAPASATLRAGMVARLDRIKDQATVLRAFAIVAGTTRDFSLHIVGDGDQRANLVRLAGNLKISDRVTFHGDVSDVYRHLRSWHIFTYATTPEEGLGSAVAEAMSNGLPCILSDLPMLRELAPGNEAWWFEAGNAQELADRIMELKNHPAMQKELGEKAYSHAVRSFDVSRFIKDYIAV